MKNIRPIRKNLNAPRSQRVVAICGDSHVGLWMLRSLARGGLTVFAVCNSEHGLAAYSRYCAGAWQVDRSDDAPPVVDQLLALAHEVGAGSIMPIAESLHQALIANRPRFEPDVHVFSPPEDCFAKAVDKAYLHSLCEQLGVPVARGTTLDRLMAADDGGTGGSFGGLRFPMVLRTSRQNDLDTTRAPWKAAYATDAEQLRRIHEQVSGYADNILVQEYHPGVSHLVHVLMHRGEPFMIGEYIGDHHVPLAGGVTVQRVSCHYEDAAADAVRLLKAIHWDGIATVQFHHDRATDKYIFIEINPRMCGGQATIIMAGFESPFLLWQSHFEPDKMKKRTYRLGLRSRVLGGDAQWLLAMLRRDELAPGQTHLSKLGAVARFLWNTGPWTKDDSFTWDDPKPYLVDLQQMIRKRLLGWDLGIGS